MRLPTRLMILALSLLVSSQGRAQASTIILARHAEKAAPSGDPGLTLPGQQRALDLAQALAKVHLTTVITTQLKRTRLTAEPAAQAADLPPIVIPATGNTNADAMAVAHAIDELPSGSVVLVVGHSNTLGPIIAALGGPRIPDLCDAEYSTLLILTRPGGEEKPSLIRSRFGAAEPPEADRCH
ncbi:MAG: histidine phosphatase family protein [Gemmatimonadota bacterium]